MCGFKNSQESSATYQWTRIQGTDNAPDHTIGSSIGHYMSVKYTSPHVASRTARLISASIPSIQTAPSCASFWYKTVGPIEFNVKAFRSNGVYEPMFSAKGDRGSEWAQGRGTVQSSGTRFQVVFEAIDQTGMYYH